MPRSMSYLGDFRGGRLAVVVGGHVAVALEISIPIPYMVMFSVYFLLASALFESGGAGPDNYI